MLSELDPSICRNFVSRNWVSLCKVFDPPPVVLIREFYSNLSFYSEVTGGHYLTFGSVVRSLPSLKKPFLRL